MSHLSFRTSSPDQWTNPRPYRDASLRLQTNGPIQPMDYRRGILARIFGRK